MHAHVIPAASLPSSLAALTPRTTTTPTDAHFYARMNSFAGNSSVDCISYLDREHLRELAEGVLDIPESEDRFFTLSKPEGTDILPLPRWLSDVYVLKWANPTRIGGGAGAAYSLDVTAGEPGRARTRHLYITYMGEAGPSRCRVALATAIQHLGPILYTAEEDARRSKTVREVRSCECWATGQHRSNGRDMNMDMDVDIDMDLGPLPVSAAA